MSPLTYHRPKTLEEAVSLLGKGSPLGGGTQLAVIRRSLTGVIDLQDLPLDGLSLQEGFFLLGAGVRLERLAESTLPLPDSLRTAIRQDAPLNVRNMATLAGALISSDGRSPLATVMLALEAVVRIEPGARELSLDDLLESRESGMAGQLITEFRFAEPKRAGYMQVGRSPKDLPIVCASIKTGSNRGALRLFLGGFGRRPLRAVAAEEALARRDLQGAMAASSALLSTADDEWASGPYRAHLAGVLTRRLAQEALAL
jgi:carbon-monoxide dehydrogenase medium subunit